MGGLFLKKYGLIFKGSAASAPTHSQRHLHARLPASGGAFGLVKSWPRTNHFYREMIPKEKRKNINYINT